MNATKPKCIGLYWFEPKLMENLEASVARAVQRYWDKHVHCQELPEVHVNAMQISEARVIEVRLRDSLTKLTIQPSKFVLINHLWVGPLKVNNGR